MLGNIGGALVVLIILIAVISGVGAIGLSDSGALTPALTQAEAERIRADTLWQEREREARFPLLQVEIERQIQIQEAEAARELARIQAEQEAQAAQIRLQSERQALAAQQSLANQAAWAETLRVLTLALGLAGILVITVFLLHLVYQFNGRQVSALAVSRQSSSEMEEALRRQQITLARMMEELERRQALASPAIARPRIIDAE